MYNKKVYEVFIWSEQQCKICRNFRESKEKIIKKWGTRKLETMKFKRVMEKVSGK